MFLEAVWRLVRWLLGIQMEPGSTQDHVVVEAIDMPSDDDMSAVTAESESDPRPFGDETCYMCEAAQMDPEYLPFCAACFFDH